MIKETRQFISEIEFTYAVKAQKVFKVLGTLTVPNLKTVIRINLIKDNEIIFNDLDSEEKAFSQDTGSLKGKTICSNPEVVLDQNVEILEELLNINKDLTLSINRITINRLKFLTIISHNIYYRTTMKLPSTDYQIVIEKTNEVIDIYKSTDFNTSEIHIDKEFNKDIGMVAKNRNLRVNYTNSKEHVPRAERHNRTMQ